MATGFLEQTVSNARDELQQKFEQRTGLIGQTIRNRRIEEQKQEQISKRVEKIERATDTIRVTASTLAGLEQSFIQISKNFQSIAKSLNAQVTLQEDTNKSLLEQPIYPAGVTAVKAKTEKAIDIAEDKEDTNLMDKIGSLLQRRVPAKTPPKTKPPKTKPPKTKLPKTKLPSGLSGALRGAGKLLGPAGLAIGAYEASEFLKETGYGEKMAKGAGRLAEKTFREKNTDFSQLPVTPQQAQDLLRGSQRDIDAFGGKERLEKIAGIKQAPTPVAKPPATAAPPEIKPIVESTAGGGRGFVNPPLVVPPEPSPQEKPGFFATLFGTKKEEQKEQQVITGPAYAPTPAPMPVTKPAVSGKDQAPTGGILDTIKAAMESFGITNPFAKSALLANIEKESGFKPRSENLAAYGKTSNERIRQIFTTRVTGLSDEELTKIKQDPVAFGDLVYGMNTKLGQGMGHTQPGDGYKYRGRGFIQITGKNNYAAFGKMIGEDLVGNPDKANEPFVAAKIAAAFVVKGLRNKLDFSSMAEANRAVTQAVGGARLNLNVGIGAEILAKVEKYSAKYIGEASTQVAAVKKDAVMNQGTNVTVIAVNNTEIKKAASPQPRREVVTNVG